MSLSPSRVLDRLIDDDFDKVGCDGVRATSRSLSIARAAKHTSVATETRHRMF